MIKSIGTKKINTAVFISGNGSNLEKLIKFSILIKSPIRINFVISSNSKAKGIKFSKKYNIKYKILSFRNKTQDEKKILVFLKRYNVKLICLAGFMKILSKNFIKKFNGKILNVHPSLLPKYKGLNTHERAINDGAKFAGCTIHLVNSRLDSGKIIMQKKVKINKTDTPSKLAKKVLKQEHILYPKALIKLFSNR